MCDQCFPEWQEYQKIENPTMADWIRAGGTTDQMGISKHGWCLTGHHKECIVVVSDGHRCGCECHGNGGECD